MLVELEDDAAEQLRCARRQLTSEPDFGTASVNDNLYDLMARMEDVE